MAKTVVVNGLVLRMQFWDTAGQERFRSLIPNYLKEAAIAFLVFDVSSKCVIKLGGKSFDNLPEWIDLCNQNMGEKCITLLLANKCDLPDREVSKEEIEAKAK
jgi:Ras-related protein Rab-2A